MPKEIAQRCISRRLILNNAGWARYIIPKCGTFIIDQDKKNFHLWASPTYVWVDANYVNDSWRFLK